MEDQLTDEERLLLLTLSRSVLNAVVRGENAPCLDHEALPPRLKTPGASFVTLTRRGALRGCIGALEACLPLAQDVWEHTVAAALYDIRFPPVQPEELPRIKIEISRLTIPQVLSYECPEELLAKLRPGIDGVVMQYGGCKATFLPQVWKKIPESDQFLNLLCRKMGCESSLWRSKTMKILTYRVEEFHE